MSESQDASTQRPRAPLSREKVLRAAMAVADEDGLGGLTIRSLAARLGVRPMSVYHHVANKEQILDGVVDLVFAEIDEPVTEGEWRAQVRQRADSARRVLARHPWSIPLLESRATPGPANLRHHDRTIGLLLAAGFSIELAAHAYALLDAFVYGHALQAAALPFEPDTVHEVAGSMIVGFAPEEYPHLVRLATEVVLQPGYAFAREFDVGLELVLDGLERRLADAG